jgi:glycosyltransferase involved in cell wall biosynthesis
MNEEANLAACLASVTDWAEEVFVVDSGSSDGTCRIAESYGAVVAEHAFETHATQWQWALDNLPLRTEWILALDADQQVTTELANEIRALSATGLEQVDGIYLNRRQVFRGRWIKHGGYYPKFLLKLFRRSAVAIDRGDLVDHHFHVPGRVMNLRHDLIEANKKEDDISFWTAKHVRYSGLLAREEIEWRTGTHRATTAPSFGGNPDQRTLAAKQIWRRMPLYVRPFLYFIYRYFVRCGFLDGKQGAIFHFLQAFWFRLLVDIRLDEMLQASRDGVEGPNDSARVPAAAKVAAPPPAPQGQQP